MSYLFSGISIKNARDTNMDSLLLKQRQINKSNALLAAVCDGVGSLSGGGFASAMAIKLLNDRFGQINSTERIGLKMRDFILDINAKIVSQAKQNNIETASTLSALLLINGNYYIINVGDSRIYCYDNDALTILTYDDVSVTGQLTAYIGRSEDIFLQYSEGAAGDKTFLICSDGLYKKMDTDFLISKLKNRNKKTFNEPIKSLPDYVIKRGEQDNITLALVKNI